MSTGLTFGSISALFGLTNKIIDQTQYTILVTAVIGSAVVPTLIAQAWFQPELKAIADDPEGVPAVVIATAACAGTEAASAAKAARAARLLIISPNPSNDGFSDGQILRRTGTKRKYQRAVRSQAITTLQSMHRIESKFFETGRLEFPCLTGKYREYCGLDGLPAEIGTKSARGFRSLRENSLHKITGKGFFGISEFARDNREYS
jgi:hypothetical protein